LMPRPGTGPWPGVQLASRWISESRSGGYLSPWGAGWAGFGPRAESLRTPRGGAAVGGGAARGPCGSRAPALGRTALGLRRRRAANRALCKAATGSMLASPPTGVDHVFSLPLDAICPAYLGNGSAYQHVDFRWQVHKLT
jgi:hypothetical protein